MKTMTPSKSKPAHIRRNVARNLPDAEAAARRIRARATILMFGLSFAIAIALLIVVLVRKANERAAEQQQVVPMSDPGLDQIPFDGRSAMTYLEQLCAIGPRPTGSAGMRRQQVFLTDHFEKLGATVLRQEFTMRHPETGGPVPGVNLIARWHPERTQRLMLCAHYDTLPFPLLDPHNPRGRFVGANDNASGVAVLMELGKHISGIDTKYGIDFVFLDAEEFKFRDGQPMFVGSEYFAQQYARGRAQRTVDYTYRWGVLLDMIGDKNLAIPREGNSNAWPDTRPLVNEIWSVAQRLGVRQFVNRVGDRISDDHITLHDTGGIPCIDIIDFSYPPWHTQADTPDQCSPLSLARVGWVVLEWLRTTK